MTPYNRIKLGELVNLIIRKEALELDKNYMQLGVRLWGNGTYLRNSIRGDEVSYTTLNKCKKDDLILSKIWARNGASSVVPTEHSSSYVSTEFPQYEICDNTRLIPEWLRYLTKHRSFWSACNEVSQGTSGKNRIKPKEVLKIKIPLPEKAEQERITFKLDKIEAKLKKTEKVKVEQSKEIESFSRSLILKSVNKKSYAISELMTLRKPDVTVSDEKSYQFSGVYSFGRGVFKKESKLGSDFSYDKLSKLRSGDFTYPKLMAWEGALGIVPEECDGSHVSTEFPVFTINTELVLPEILEIHFKSATVWEKLAELSTGTNMRRRRLNPTAFLNYSLELPNIEEQKKIVKIYKKAKKIQAMSEDTQRKTEILLSATLDKIFQ